MQGYPQAADIGAAGAGQIQGGAVIHRGADDGQAQGDVHRLAESLVLEHRQALVVIHGQYRVGMVQILGREESVRRQGAFQQHALATQALEQWDDHIQLLAAQMATLAGMGVQPADQDAWGGQAEPGLQVPVEYAYDLFEGLVGDGIGYCAQWQVGGGQGHAQAGQASIITTLGVPVCSAKNSVCPEKLTPASLMTPLCTGAVTTAAKSPSRQPWPPRRRVSRT